MKEITRDDSVNGERAAEVGIEMKINLDGQSVTSTIYGCQVKGKSPVITQKDFHGQQEEDSP